MTKVKKLTLTQKNKLVNKEFSDDSIFNPIQDINGIWVISLEESELAEGFFLWVKDLPEIDYNPKELPLLR